MFNSTRDIGEWGPVFSFGANVDHAVESLPVNVLDEDVGCPGCGYNLRGLGSDVVVCPECGQENDVAVLLVRRWDKPWYRAPRYNTICLPAAVVLLTLLGWVAALAFAEIWMSGLSRITGMSMVLVGLAGWAGTMAMVWNKLDGLASAGFALLAHIPIVGYLSGLVMFLSGLSLSIAWLFDYADSPRKPGFSGLVIGVLLLLGGVGLFVLSRWIERLVAGHCIRLYLRRPTTSG